MVVVELVSKQDGVISNVSIKWKEEGRWFINDL